MKKDNVLVGKMLIAVYVSKDRLAMRFNTTDGKFIARCDADCCSYTWVEHVEVPKLPATVLSVEDIEMPTDPNPGGKKGPENTEEVAFYGCRITTDQGHLIIDYRNDSNGYYGGDLKWPGEYHYGGVHGQNDSKEEWCEVTWGDP